MSSPACRARITDSRDPLDSNSVSDFDGCCFGSGTHLDNLANSFVATDLAGLCGSWESSPAVRHDAKVGVAYTGMGEVYENLTGTRLWGVEFDYFGGDFARLIVDAGLVLLWNVRHDIDRGDHR